MLPECIDPLIVGVHASGILTKTSTAAAMVPADDKFDTSKTWILELILYLPYPSNSKHRTNHSRFTAFTLAFQNPEKKQSPLKLFVYVSYAQLIRVYASIQTSYSVNYQLSHIETTRYIIFCITRWSPPLV